jgi:hypothetical protein
VRRAALEPAPSGCGVAAGGSKVSLPFPTPRPTRRAQPNRMAAAADQDGGWYHLHTPTTNCRFPMLSRSEWPAAWAPPWDANASSAAAPGSAADCATTLLDYCSESDPAFRAVSTLARAWTGVWALLSALELLDLFAGGALAAARHCRAARSGGGGGGGGGRRSSILAAEAALAGGRGHTSGGSGRHRWVVAGCTAVGADLVRHLRSGAGIRDAQLIRGAAAAFLCAVLASNPAAFGPSTSPGAYFMCASAVMGLAMSWLMVYTSQLAVAVRLRLAGRGGGGKGAGGGDAAEGGGGGSSRALTASAQAPAGGGGSSRALTASAQAPAGGGGSSRALTASAALAGVVVVVGGAPKTDRLRGGAPISRLVRYDWLILALVIPRVASGWAALHVDAMAVYLAILCTACGYSAAVTIRPAGALLAYWWARRASRRGDEQPADDSAGAAAGPGQARPSVAGTPTAGTPAAGPPASPQAFGPNLGWQRSTSSSASGPAFLGGGTAPSPVAHRSIQLSGKHGGGGVSIDGILLRHGLMSACITAALLIAVGTAVRSLVLLATTGATGELGDPVMDGGRPAAAFVGRTTLLIWLVPQWAVLSVGRFAWAKACRPGGAGAGCTARQVAAGGAAPPPPVTPTTLPAQSTTRTSDQRLSPSAGGDAECGSADGGGGGGGPSSPTGGGPSSPSGGFVGLPLTPGASPPRAAWA